MQKEGGAPGAVRLARAHACCYACKAMLSVLRLCHGPGILGRQNTSILFWNILSSDVCICVVMKVITFIPPRYRGETR